MPYIDVVFPVAHPHPLTYYTKSEIPAGTRVKAPLKNRTLIGFVVSVRKDPPSVACKEAFPIDHKPIIPASVIKLIEWISDYYSEPPGLVWSAALPPYIREGKEPSKTTIHIVQLADSIPSIKLTRKQKELVEVLKREGAQLLSELEKTWGISRAVAKALEKKGVVKIVETSHTPSEEEPIQEDIRLTQEQREVIESILKYYGRFHRFLLHGITGSGKTEVYKQLALRAIQEGKGVLILVPEISLTPHYIKRFKTIFKDKLAVLHSGLSPKERANQWKGIKEGIHTVVVGTRSAIFAPINKCGLIVVDEEHDPSFKQQESPRYNARDVAIVRAKLEGCPVVLGSATPSVESYWNAVNKRYTLVTLTKRIGASQLPRVEIVDMRKEKGTFSRRLLESIEEALLHKKATMILINRRGYSKVIVCRYCGACIRCPNCEVSLTPYKTTKGFVFLCHWCGYRQNAFSLCPRCHKEGLKMIGYGTQRVEEELRKLFPDARIARMDRESAQSRFARWKILSDMDAGKIDILVGTQMIAKGHHFPRVILSAILNADSGINIPDFRAPERTFQLICQMAGRAGRGEYPGKVIVQCYNPQHYSIIYGARQSYTEFFEIEIEEREKAEFPPFSHLLRIILTGNNRDKVKEAALKLASVIEAEEVIGPAPSGIEKLKNRYRWHIIVKSKSRKRLIQIANSLPHCIGSIRVFKDMDPYEFI